MVQRQEKEYDIVTHGNLELLIKHVNDRLKAGWNILGYPSFLDGRWVQPVTRTIYRDE